MRLIVPCILPFAGVYLHNGDLDYATGDADGRNVRQPQYLHTTAVQEEEVFSVFTALTWHETEKLDASFGLRWTRTKKQFSGIDSRIRRNNVADEDVAVFSALVLADLNSGHTDYLLHSK